MYETFEHGEGTPLVMLHGLMGDPSNWQGTFPHLPDSCRAIALQFPFFQDGHRLDSLQGATEYAHGYLDHAGIDRVVLCGNSLGGHVGLKLAIQMPQRVTGLVLTGSSGLFERSFGDYPGVRPPREWVRAKMCEIFYDPSFVTDQLVNEVCEVIAVRRNARDLVRIAKSAKHDNVAGRLKDVRCPVLLIWGMQDQITPPDVAEDFRRALRHSELAWLNECGHAPMMEQPKAFADELCRWWDRVVCPQCVTGTDGLTT